jgi:hypothetical protein
VRRTELHGGEVLRWLAKEQVDEVYEILGFRLCIEKHGLSPGFGLNGGELWLDAER